MLVYNDLISGDEMMTDAFKRSRVKDSEGEIVEGMFEIQSDVTIKGADNVDIGCGNSFGGGGEDEAVDDTVEKVNNVIDPFNYSECPFGSKTELKDYLKEYCKKVRSVLKENGVAQPKIKEFMAQAPGFVKYLLSQYNELQFYVGSSYNPEGAMAFSYYKEGATTPTFMYIEGGLKQEKF